jgi:hypothetical protein
LMSMGPEDAATGAGASSPTAMGSSPSTSDMMVDLPSQNPQ